ncbi:MAG TPA: LacI family DNA-binding transcriptional regulator [Chitinophagaceae bacterium]|jgi:LacI family transcriptional regulator|nr:LacI family DNA-binding transcriptional regulator [Chitinophagaceae bacterium]
MKKVSLKDIARKVGVSPSTVSFVLNGKAQQMRISEDLAQKIISVAREDGYHPNQVAVSLRTGQSKTLALIVENIANSFFASLAKIIEDEARAVGYRIIYCSTENDPARASEIIQHLSRQQIDGYIITPAVQMEDDILRLLGQNKPVVLLDRYLPNLDIPFVMVDNYAGISLGVDHLVQRGHRHIGFVTVNLDMVQMKEREVSFSESATRHGLASAPVLTLGYGATREASIDALMQFIQAHPEVEALFFATNYLGIFGIEALGQLGKSIPGDMAVLSFDDDELFRLYPPGITSIRQPIAEIAQQAIHLLLDQLGGRTDNCSRTGFKLPASLVLRNST